jgi:RNA polymerase sigma factor (sigma-70 family)
MPWSSTRPYAAPPTGPAHRGSPVAGGPDSTSAALESVITRFARLLHHVATRHGLASDDVDEVVQEVRVRLWRARQESETIAGLGTSYIYRTALSAALEVVRRKRGSGRVTSLAEFRDERGEHEALASVESDERGPEHTLARAEFASAVAAAMLELADARRTAVRLHLVGYSRDEIAGMTGWSAAKARNLIYRGLADLRAALVRRGISPGELG